METSINAICSGTNDLITRHQSGLLIDNQRHYDIYGDKLPSVTTIPQATIPEEKRQSLARWKQKVGDNEADRIRDGAAARGTIMHRIIEGYVTGDGHQDLSDMGQAAGPMAQTVFKPGSKGLYGGNMGV